MATSAPGSKRVRVQLIFDLDVGWLTGPAECTAIAQEHLNREVKPAVVDAFRNTGLIRLASQPQATLIQDLDQ